jgi:hypothetical protein
VNNGGQAGTKPKKKKGKKGLPVVVAVVGGVAGGDWQRRWWFAAASGAAPSSSSLLCFSFFSQLLFFFGLLPLFSTLTLFSFLSDLFLSALLPLSHISFFFFSSPVFIGKNRGETWLGGHCAASPPPPLQHVESFSLASGVGRRLFERESTSF